MSDYVYSVNEYIDSMIMDSINIEESTACLLVELESIFKAEKGYAIPQKGRYCALVDWIAGLPSVFNIPYTNFDIIEIGKKCGSIDENSSGDEQQEWVNGFFPLVAERTIILFDR